MKRKPIHKSRTNRSAAALAAGAIAIALLKHHGVDVQAILDSAGLDIADVMAVLATVGASAVVVFRQAATKGTPVDQQGKVTPR